MNRQGQVRPLVYLSLVLAQVVALIASAAALTSCGNDLKDVLEEYKNCEIITHSNKRRCTKRQVDEGVSFSTDRRYFQARDVIYFGIDDELLHYGHYFSVINSSTESVLIDDEPVPESPAEYEGFSLFEDTTVKVRLHPLLNPEHYLWGGQANNLRVVSRRGNNGNFRFHTTPIYLVDYNWVGAQAIALPSVDGEAEVGATYKADLWISEQEQPSAHSADVSVIIGGYSALNPMN